MEGESTENVLEKKKAHRERKSGRKAEKKKAKKVHVQELTDKQRNPKAFAIRSAVTAERRFRRKQDIETKKQHVPLVDRTPLEPPPLVVAVVGPAKVGKTTLIQNLIKHWAKQPLKLVKGPVTIVTGKKRRITIIECNNDINSMIDLAKVADLILLMIDASFGFEMEIFEFLNICQVHGMPRILGVLTHLDQIKQSKQLKKVKKTLKHRFWTEVYPGAKLFYLSGMIHGQYLNNDIRNLGRFIACIKLRPLTWRSTHPYMLVDRLEDITDPEKKRQNPKCDRNVCLYGYMRGIALNKENGIHIPGCGDSRISNVSFLPDPCPLPERKKRSLIERERLIYAPFSGVGGIVYDKDAVYIELAGSHSHNEDQGEATEYFQSMLTAQDGMDVKRDKSELKIFSSSKPIISSEFQDANAFTSENVIEDTKEDENDKVEDTAPSKILSEDEDDFEDSEGEEEEEEEEKNKNFCEEKVEADGRIRRKVIFNDEMDDDSTTDKESDTSDDEESLKNENFEFRGLKKDLDIKSKITEVLNKLEIKDSVSKKEAKSESSSEESGIEMELEDIRKEEKRKHSSSESEEEDENVKKRLKGDETSDEDDDEEMGTAAKGKENAVEDKKKKLKGFVSSEEEADDEDNDYEMSAVKWKENLAQKAADAFIDRQNSTQNLYKLVYGEYKKSFDNPENQEEEEDKEEIGGIFHLVSEKQRQKMQEKDELDEFDCSIFPVSQLRDWTQRENKFLIKDCFVTGKWKKTEDAEELLKLDALSDDDEEYGDFEDLETGEKHTAKKPEDKPPKEDNQEDKAALLERKKKLKEKFDAEYDEEEDESTYYNELKTLTDQQAQLNKEEFEGLPDDVRVELEGFRPGMYVRIEVSDMPCELVEYFDPTFPLIVGGLLPNEENIGFLQGRLKKHRWYGKILKTKDPLIVSLGWRRFQTLPIFTKLEDNFRQRMLKYTPQHVSCMGHMFGPITPQGAGFLAVQNVAVRPAGFRIACTGVIVEVDKSTTITKKLKLIGTPQKIYQKTAFIHGMFNSALEVGKFEGAKIRTVSGIRGQIKKALNKPPGAFRATFEDKIKKSDIVFCRTWYPVDVPKFYNPVTSLLLAPEQKTAWEGMKTLGQLKRERSIKNEVEADSLYTPILRKPKRFKPLKIPKQLQKSLPYKDKPKEAAKKKNPNAGRVAVIREPHEQETAGLLKMIKKNYEHKRRVEKQAMRERVVKHKQVVRQEELRKLKRQKELKKQICRTLSKMEKSKKKPK